MLSLAITVYKWLILVLGIVMIGFSIMIGGTMITSTDHVQEALMTAVMGVFGTVLVLGGYLAILGVYENTREMLSLMKAQERLDSEGTIKIVDGS